MEQILTTKNIKVSVSPRFEEGHSNIKTREYLFSYTIKIENLGENPVQLISRYWRIYSEINDVKIVKGPGVIGQQPILKPGQIHEYSSWSKVSCYFGSMRGHFEMINLTTGENFLVKIPTFYLTPPFKLN